ncbi:hypothetical protein V6N13_008754 [Hibiscus sabdariffa]|uniref:Uncharacterized protein n=1 Tax=Hibiscus sabdariffa TaxID=183260 RepID=A0ABR2ECV6_9ROSI
MKSSLSNQQVHWCTPLNEFVKANFDASFSAHLRVPCVGVLVQDLVGWNQVAHAISKAPIVSACEQSWIEEVPSIVISLAESDRRWCDPMKCLFLPHCLAIFHVVLDCSDERSCIIEGCWSGWFYFFGSDVSFSLHFFNVFSFDFLLPAWYHVSYCVQGAL